MAEFEFELVGRVPDGVDYDRAFSAVADLVHGSDVPGVEVFCSGQGQDFTVTVFIDDDYDSSWNEVPS